MNIAIFTNNYLPNHYGVTNSIESFRKQFEKMGHTVYIFAPAYKNYTDNNPNVFRYPALDIRYRIKFPIPIPYSKKVERKIKELKIDIIHSQHPNLLGTVAYRLAKERKIPLIFTWHTLYDMYVSYVPFPFAKLAKFWIIGSAVKYANKADQVIVPTNSVKKIIKEWGVKNKNIIDIPTGVEEKLFDNSDAEKIRKKLKISSDKKIILSIS
ncbi:MAG TPA: glycosyltransferase family 4 protein, partial [Candidatus Moranbacteria bacterium]|nr:glycosyltransferase family 4 protein [Candidatus Moranbacteria bacterium]